MSAFCALCLDPIVGNPKKQPLGRNDAYVNVCNTCDSAHPRTGLYSFDTGAIADRHVTNGNKHRTPRGVRR